MGIEVARETLEVHETLCARLFSRSHHQIRAYIDWNLSICPFTPFIVVLGTAILDTNAADMHLLEKVVESLERASVLAPGAKKLLSICKILLQGKILRRANTQQWSSTGTSSIPAAAPDCLVY